MIVEVRSLRSLGERTYTLEVDADATVLHCKHLLEPMVADGSDASRYTLVHLGNVLGTSRDRMTLAELGFADRDFFVLVISASERAASVAEAMLAAQQAAAAQQAEAAPLRLARMEGRMAPRLAHYSASVRKQVLAALGTLDPATLAQHADAVVARLDDSDSWSVRCQALATLGKLYPASLAQYGDAVVARLEDSEAWGRQAALVTLGKLHPATLAWHADAVVARLQDPRWTVRKTALETLGKLALATLAPHFNAVVARRGDAVDSVREKARQLSGCLRWYRCRLRLLCVERLTLYWYALPYRPGGPGHARDVQELDQMMRLCNQDQSTRAEKRRRRAEDGHAATQ